jgi:hypothetical protein
MRSPEADDQIDALVASFLITSDEAEANSLLEQLICRHSMPMIRNIVGSAVRFYLTPFEGGSDLRDLDDISGDVVLKLLKSLRRLKTSLSAETSSSFQRGGFRSYVAVTTYNTCYDYLRNKYPQRHKLKKRLKYTLSHQPGLALWENDEICLCGLAHWDGLAKSHDSKERLRELHSNLQSFRQSLSLKLDGRSEDLAQTLHAIFSLVGSPVELDPLVSIVAELLEVRSHMLVAGRDYEHGSDLQRQIPDLQEKVGARLEQQAYLEQLWEEITLLPLGQRTALLLSLKDSQGNEIVSLLDHLRIATLSQIADALAISAERFAELWKSSPIDDNAIAKHLGVTRQQVINLRLSARRRLARHIEARARQTHR